MICLNKTNYPESFNSIPSVIVTSVFKGAGILGLLALAALIVGILLPGFNNLPYIIIFSVLCVLFSVRGYLVLKDLMTNGYIIIKGTITSINAGRFDKKQYNIQFAIDDGDEVSSNDKYLSFPYSGPAKAVEGGPVTLYVSPLTSIENNSDYGRYINCYYAVQFTMVDSNSEASQSTTIADFVGANSDEENGEDT